MRRMIKKSTFDYYLTFCVWRNRNTSTCSAKKCFANIIDFNRNTSIFALLYYFFLILAGGKCTSMRNWKTVRGRFHKGSSQCLENIFRRDELQFCTRTWREQWEWRMMWYVKFSIFVNHVNCCWYIS